MTQPTQQLPPYLSATTFTVVTDGFLSTGTTIVQIPLTYFGPSIPLGTNGVWTFGGSTSPPSTSSMAITSAATPSTISPPSAIPTVTSISSSPSSSAATSLSSSSAATSSSPSSSSITSPPPTTAGTSSQSTSASSSFSLPFPTPTSTQADRVRRALPGIIIGVLIFVLALAAVTAVMCFRRYQRRREMRTAHRDLSDFVIIDPEGGMRVAGEGVARPTGGEEDSFLSRSADATDAMSERDPSARLIGLAHLHKGSPSPDRPSGGEGVALLTDASPAQTSTSATVSPSLTHKARMFSGSVTSLFFNPNRGTDTPGVQEATREESSEVGRDSSSTQPSSGPSYVRGPIIPPRQLLEMDSEWQREAEAAEAAAIAARQVTPDVTAEMPTSTSYAIPDSPLRPPRVLNPDHLPIPLPYNLRRDSGATQLSSPYSDTPLSDPEFDENATLLTARRMNMNEAGPSTLYNVSAEEQQSSAFGTTFGLGGLTRLSRLSWFQRMDASRSRLDQPPRSRFDQSRSRSPSDSHIVSRRASRPASPPAGRQLTDREIQAGRVLLGASARSATSLDAAMAGPRPVSQVSVQSRLSAVSSGGNTVYHDAMSSVSSRSRPGTPLRHVRTRTPPPDMPLPVPPVPTPPAPTHVNDNPSGVTIDILDIPAPSPMSPFSTTSSRGGPMFPPGLEGVDLAAPGMWRESSSDMPSPASVGSAASGGPVGVLVGGQDVLEQEPPRAGEGWSHLRAMAGGMDTERRTTLGQPVLIDRFDNAFSERGSLHSLPRGLSPLSPTAAGSRSRLSEYNSSYGSGSSRRSAALTNSSRGSLMHSGSVSSDGRRRRRREPGEPDTAGAPPPGFGRASLSAMGSLTPFGTPQRATFTSSMTGGTATTSASGGTTDLSSGGSGTTQTTPVDSQGAAGHFPTVRLV